MPVFEAVQGCGEAKGPLPRITFTVSSRLRPEARAGRTLHDDGRSVEPRSRFAVVSFQDSGWDPGGIRTRYINDLNVALYL